MTTQLSSAIFDARVLFLNNLVAGREDLLRLGNGKARIPFRTSKIGPRRKRGTGTLARAPVPRYEKNEGP